MSLERLAFELVVAKLDAQRNDLTRLRGQARASATITGLIGALFASLIGPDFLSASFVGNKYLGFSLPAALMLFCFVSSISLACMVLVNREEVTFSFETEILLRNQSKHPSLENLFACYVSDGELFFRRNESVISRIQWTLWWATVLGWVQIIPWIIIILEVSDV
jgi:hypothetical protein